MTYLKQCYYSSMRPFRDRPDILIKGRWHWCPPGARVIPYRHLFGPFTMDPSTMIVDPPVGEVPVWNGRSRGNSSPRYQGKNWCGSQEVWTRGALYSALGTPAVDDEHIPLCCDSAPPTPGGACAGGEMSVPVSGGGVGGGGVFTAVPVGGGAVAGGSDGGGCVNSLTAPDPVTVPDILFATIEDVAGVSGLVGTYPLMRTPPVIGEEWSGIVPIGLGYTILLSRSVLADDHWSVELFGIGTPHQLRATIECTSVPLCWEPVIFGPDIPDLFGTLVRISICQHSDAIGGGVGGGGTVDGGISAAGGGGIGGGGMTRTDLVGGGGVAGGEVIVTYTAGGGGIGGGGLMGDVVLLPVGGGGIGGGYLVDSILVGGGGIAGGGSTRTDLLGGGGVAGGGSTRTDLVGGGGVAGGGSTRTDLVGGGGVAGGGSDD